MDSEEGKGLAQVVSVGLWCTGATNSASDILMSPTATLPACPRLPHGMLCPQALWL